MSSSISTVVINALYRGMSRKFAVESIDLQCPNDSINWPHYLYGEWRDESCCFIQCMFDVRELYQWMCECLIMINHTELEVLTVDADGEINGNGFENAIDEFEIYIERTIHGKTTIRKMIFQTDEYYNLSMIYIRELTKVVAKKVK